MSLNTDLINAPLIRDDDEGLFSRDINGQLVRLDAPTESDYDTMVSLQVDGRAVTVPLAEPLKDANGNIVLDLDGRTKPRYTTIYDAARKAFAENGSGEGEVPIPTLCHLPHMAPVAVCRLCVVQIYGQKRGRRAAERKLLPACQHQVKEGMEVFTMADPGPDGERVRRAVKTIGEMLAHDHLKPAPQPEIEKDLGPLNELGKIVQRCGADSSQLGQETISIQRPAATRKSFDGSSPVFAVDHSACILCDRCVRACNDVMDNNIIGRTGKGAHAAIGFDLNVPMGRSDCVQCGECMISCPTSAITFKSVARVKCDTRTRDAEPVSAGELLKDPIFSGVPPKMLLWQQGLVIRRWLKPGQVLVRQGDPGNTAFIIRSGRLKAVVYQTGPYASPFAALSGSRRDIAFETELTPADFIVGEMACLSAKPRTADLVAVEKSEVWEFRRNLLDRLMRVPSQRRRLEEFYRQRSLDLVLRDSKLFRGIPEAERGAIIDRLRQKLRFVRVQAGQDLFEQGDRATDLYFVRLGYVRICVQRGEEEPRVLSQGPGTILGEIGLLGLTQADATRTVDEVDRSLEELLNRPGIDPAECIPVGVRSAGCSALSPLELVRISRADFLPLLREFPTLRRRLVEHSLFTLSGNQEVHFLLNEFVDQGLYEGRSILALDLELCTRCDECTKGCIQQHGTDSHGVPVTRLLRDGMRFGKYMVATSCRSCVDPHCMEGCPVDSIHRGKHHQIVIEDHCIGCGLCASNCPYGSIFMLPNVRDRIETPDPLRPGKSYLMAQTKATVCDLCDAEGTRDTPRPRCVSSCPHDAAHRVTGDELLRLVLGGSRLRG